METRTYECQYCRKEYVPKRRGVQKFCSNSCRVRSHQIKKCKQTTTTLVTSETTLKQGKTKIEQMSFAGVGNAAVGNLIVDGLKTLLIKDENKAATKQDINQLNFKLNQVIEMIEKNENDIVSKFKPI